MSFYPEQNSVLQPHHCRTNSDEECAIVLAIRANDVNVFATLFRAYYRDLTRYAYAITHSGEMAEEVVDDVFVALWDRRAEWAPVSTIQAYLFRAVRNRALSAILSEKSTSRVARLAGLEVKPIAMSQEPATPDQALASNETETAVWTAVDALPQESRTVVALRWRAGMSWGEVAEVTGLSIAAAQMKHTRALRLLKERLSDIII